MGNRTVEDWYRLLRQTPMKGWKDIADFLKIYLTEKSFLPRTIGEENRIIMMADSGKAGKTIILYLNITAPKILESCAVVLALCDSFSGNNLLSGKLGVLFQDAEPEGEYIAIESSYMLGITFSPEMDIAYPLAASYVTHNVKCKLDINISGLTSHGAAPHLGINSLDAAALAVNAAHFAAGQLAPSCKIRPLIIDTGNGAINMIPDHTNVILEIQSLNHDYLEKNTAQIKNVIRNAVEAIGAVVSIEEIAEQKDVAFEHGKMVDVLNLQMKKWCGEKNVVTIAHVHGTDDFHNLRTKYHCDGAYMGFPITQEVMSVMDISANVVKSTVQCLARDSG